MSDSCAALEFPVMTLVKPAAAYVIRFRGTLSTKIEGRLQEYWRLAWEQAGRKAPPLIILDSNLELTALGGDELRAVGLLRIKAAGQ